MPKRKAAVAADNKIKKARTGDSHAITEFNLDWHMEGRLDTNGIGTLIALDGEQPGCTKVAGFDIDFTIIQTKSGRKFATGAGDWEFLYSCVPDKLRELNKNGYRVIFFTNQAGIEKQKVKPAEIITKVNSIIKDLDIPVFTYVCTGTNEFRKPATNMWDYFVENSNKGVKVDMKKSFYVGDAAGRPAEWAPGKPKDFSCSDRMFAANIGIDFKTPEEFFLDEEPATFKWGSLDPSNYLKKNKPSKSISEEYHSKNKEMVVMVGAPATGKSTFTKRFLVSKKYVSVNRDTLKTQTKCMKAASEALDDGKSVVIDNTNPSKSVRADYIDIAKNAEVPVRCFVMKTPLEVAHHLNYVRQTLTNGEVRRVPDVAYNMFKKNFQEPQLDEGFNEIKTIEFTPYFDSQRQETVFNHWTTGGH